MFLGDNQNEKGTNKNAEGIYVDKMLWKHNL